MDAFSWIGIVLAGASVVLSVYTLRLEKRLRANIYQHFMDQEMKRHGMHASDCAAHDTPAFDAGNCDCWKSQ